MNTTEQEAFTAIRVRSSSARTTWRVSMPGGKDYFAHTYPGSDLLCLERSGRRVHGANVESMARAAICIAIAKAA